MVLTLILGKCTDLEREREIKEERTRESTKKQKKQKKSVGLWGKEKGTHNVSDQSPCAIMTPRGDGDGDVEMWVRGGGMILNG